MLRHLMLVLVVVVAVGCESDGTKSSASSKSKSGSGLASSSLQPPQAQSQARRADPVYAYVDKVRGELSDGKAQLINQVMRLSRDESAKFWPIYHEYEDELFALGDERVEMTRKFAAAHTMQSLDNQQAAALADDWFRIESRRLDLLRKYHQLISKELSPIRAAQFAQIEHRVDVVIDLLVASELPLVDAQVTQRR